FAGNALLVSPELLVEQGLLREGDCGPRVQGATRVDYPGAARFKHRLLEVAWSTFKTGDFREQQAAYEEFCAQQAHWLEAYALFRALKIRHGGAHYLTWPAELVRREPDALRSAAAELGALIDQVRFAQFLIFRQGERLRGYARSRGL